MSGAIRLSNHEMEIWPIGLVAWLSSHFVESVDECDLATQPVRTYHVLSLCIDMEMINVVLELLNKVKMRPGAINGEEGELGPFQGCEVCYPTLDH